MLTKRNLKNGPQGHLFKTWTCGVARPYAICNDADELDEEKCSLCAHGNLLGLSFITFG